MQSREHEGRRQNPAMPRKPRRGRRPRLSRDRKIVKSFVEGKSLAEIGKEVGISKQRVHQILPRLERAIQEALKRVDYDLDKSLTKVIEMTEAETTEEHFASHRGIIMDERVVRKADNTTRMRARELMLRLNVGSLDNRAAAPGGGTQPPRITINLAALPPETAREFLEILREQRAQAVGGAPGQPVQDADRDPDDDRVQPDGPWHL